MTDTTTLARQLEAILFLEGEPMQMKRLCALLSCDSIALMKAIEVLQVALEGRGIALLRTDSDIALAIDPSTEAAITARGAEGQGQGREIGDAGLEVLAILLYKGPSTRAEIDYIRGVNSSFTIRSLLSRALVERVRGDGDGREYVYKPTLELLAHLGVREGSELPSHATISAELAAFEKSRETEQHAVSTGEQPTSGGAH